MASNIVYAINLPCPMLSGNKQQGGSTFKRSTFDHSIRQRKSYCASYDVGFSFTAETASQMADFREFYYKVLGLGVQSFLAEWDIEGDSSQKEFRFSNIYGSKPMGNNVFRITATFQLLSKIQEL